MAISAPTWPDRDGILALYQAVAATPGGLARTREEITPAYVDDFLTRALASGVILVARDPGTGLLQGEIHALALKPAVFVHVLGDVTLVVHQDARGHGLGRALVAGLLNRVRRERPDIRRIELVARESNRRAIELYQGLGFRPEGRLEGRIRRADGGYEADIPMAWYRDPC